MKKNTRGSSQLAKDQTRRLSWGLACSRNVDKTSELSHTLPIANSSASFPNKLFKPFGLFVINLLIDQPMLDHTRIIISSQSARNRPMSQGHVKAQYDKYDVSIFGIVDFQWSWFLVHAREQLIVYSGLDFCPCSTILCLKSVSHQLNESGGSRDTFPYSGSTDPAPALCSWQSHKRRLL